MLTMDVARLSHAQLADAISQWCSRFGSVREITILQPPEEPRVAFALVGMKSVAEIDRVVENLGAARVDSLAVIKIEQEQACVN